MRPIHLEFRAFGSYPEKVEVDFTVLAQRGLFVVTGDTGTGKTTIFDAMCFALYGNMPRKENRDVRSHHAAADTTTYVKFTFDIDGRRYVAHRTPEYFVPGRKTPVKGTALLVEQRPDGTTLDVATRARDVDDASERIIGLKADQFQRVILLPQGEVEKFLLANSKDREELLGQLFGGDVFDAVLDGAKDLERSLGKQVGDVNIHIDRQVANARDHLARLHDTVGLAEPEGLESLGRDHLEALALAADQPLAALQKTAGAATERVQAASTALAEAKAGADRFTSAAALRAELQQLEAERAACEAGAAAAAASATARPVMEAVSAVQGASVRHEAAVAALAERIDRLHAALHPAGVELDTTSASAVLALLADLRTDTQRQRAVQQAHRDATAAVQEAVEVLAELEAERTGLEQQRAERDEQVAADDAALPDAQSAAVPLDGVRDQITQAQEWVSARAECDGLLAALVEAKVAADQLATEYDNVFQRFVHTTAPRLAAQLRPGEPCTVCGATEHPRPAVADDGEPTSFAEVEAASAASTIAAAERSRLEAALAAVRTRLGDHVDRSADELAALVTERKAHLAEVEAAHARRDELEVRLRDGRAALSEMVAQIAGLGGRIAAGTEVVAEKQSALAAATAELAALDLEHLARVEGALAAAEPCCDRLDDVFSAVTTHTGALAQAQRSLEDTLAASPFTDAAAAGAVLLEPGVEQSLAQAAATHRTAMQRVTTGLELLDGQGIPEEMPDVAAAQADADTTAEESRGVQEAATTAGNAANDLREALAEHDRLVAGSGDLREQHRLAAKVARVLDKGGALSMPLRRWVLANQLDRVTNAANVHLQRMTNSRYTLRRREESLDLRRASGLDLEVLDAHTGRARATTSLSGGEQFQASLSLALGLADVVSLGGNGSGKRFEALFVDEGFGSLDPAALEEAIGALHQLHATGRMVGAITHVEAMKQDLHLGIVVTRLPDGKGSTLKVNP